VKPPTEIGPLRHGINLVVRAEQRRLQQHAALERFGVAHRSHLHVNPRAVFHERRNVRRDHDHRDIFGRKCCHRHIDAVTPEHVGDGLLGVNRVLVAIPRQPGDQAVADELVVPRAGHHHQIAHAHAGGRRGQDPGQPQQQTEPQRPDGGHFNLHFPGDLPDKTNRQDRSRPPRRIP
jgi:hypothetical protein